MEEVDILHNIHCFPILLGLSAARQAMCQGQARDVEHHITAVSPTLPHASCEDCFKSVHIQNLASSKDHRANPHVMTILGTRPPAHLMPIY